MRAAGVDGANNRKQLLRRRALQDIGRSSRAKSTLDFDVTFRVVNMIMRAAGNSLRIAIRALVRSVQEVVGPLA